jgi:hypothetical protein
METGLLPNIRMREDSIKHPERKLAAKGASRLPFRSPALWRSCASSYPGFATLELFEARSPLGVALPHASTGISVGHYI